MHLLHSDERINYGYKHRSHRVKIFVDVLRNWSYFSVQIVFNWKQIMFIVLRDKVDCYTTVTKAAWSSYPMQVGFGVLREVEVDYNIDWNDINTSGKQICANQTPCITIFEVMVNSKNQMWDLVI